MAKFNYTRAASTADRLMSNFGKQATLRRDGQDRSCTAVVVEFSPRLKGFVVEGAMNALISTLDPSTKSPLADPPDAELDELVFAGAVYKFAAPVSGPRPGGTVVFYDAQVVFSENEES